MSALAGRTAANGGFLTRVELSRFPVEGLGDRRLIDTSKGIGNPHDLQATLTVLSSADGPYDDQGFGEGLVQYAYRAGSTQGDNATLRRAKDLGLPIIVLRTIARGVFVPFFPCYVLKDDQSNHRFVIALDASLRYPTDDSPPDQEDSSTDQRQYAARVVRQRLHQREFRARVILAYDGRCAVCELHETDGPMLRHGLQEMHGRRIRMPRQRGEYPDPIRLALHYQHFLAAS